MRYFHTSLIYKNVTTSISTHTFIYENAIAYLYTSKKKKKISYFLYLCIYLRYFFKDFYIYIYEYDNPL